MVKKNSVKKAKKSFRKCIKKKIKKIVTRSKSKLHVSDNLTIKCDKEFKSFFDGKKIVGYVTKIKDGDTIKINVDLSSMFVSINNKEVFMNNISTDLGEFTDSNTNIFSCTVRIFGINAPEMKPSLDIEEAMRKQIIENANKAKSFLQNKLYNKFVICDCYNLDNFGRILADVYLSDKTIMEQNNTYIIDANLENMSQSLLDNKLVTAFRL